VAELPVILGVFFGLLSYEFLGLSAGGFVTPGYFALFFDQPVRIAGTILVGLAALLVIRLVSGYFVLFGRRRFAVMMLVGFLLKYLWDSVLVTIPIPLPELRVIGFIVPGLIANDMERHGVVPTLCGMAIVSSIVYLAFQLIRGVVP